VHQGQIGVVVAQDLLGHADSRTTREIYTHVSEQMMGDAVDAISAAVQGVMDERSAARGSRNGSLAYDEDADGGEEEGGADN
jgi:hypothetical protein